MESPQEVISTPMPQLQNDAGCSSINFGKNYKLKLMALISLRSIAQAKEDIQIGFTADDFATFGDIITHVKTREDVITYVLKLNHEEDPRDIMEEEFIAAQGEFSLVSCFEDIVKSRSAFGLEFKEMGIDKHSDSINNFYFIFYTNRTLNTCQFLEKCYNSNLVFINTDKSIANNKYKFIAEHLREKVNLSKLDCFNNIRLLTNQIHEKQLDDLILREVHEILNTLLLKEVNTETIAESFTNHLINLTKYNLHERPYWTKQDTLLKFTELFLSQYEINMNQEEFVYYNSPKKHIWNEIIQENAITIIDSNQTVLNFLMEYIGSEVKKYIRVSTSSWTSSISEQEQSLFYQEHDHLKIQMLKIINNNRNVTLLDIYKCLWLNYQLPLLLQINNTQEYTNIIRILELSNFNYKIILMNNLKGALPKTSFRAFENLSNLCRGSKNKILKQPVKLQSRAATKLENLIDEDMAQYIKCNDIINILLDDFNIGNKFELPEHFIEPSINKIFLQPEVLQKVNDDIFLIEEDCNFEGPLIESTSICKLEDVDLGNLNSGIFTSQKNYNKEKIEKLKSAGKALHYLCIYDKDHLEWKWTSGSAENIKPFQIPLKYIYNSDVRHLFNNDINLICAPTDMENSSFIDYIVLNIPSNMWILQVNLNQHKPYYVEENCFSSSTEAANHLEFFYNKDKRNTKLADAIFQKLTLSKDIVVFMGGFHETLVPYQEAVINITESLRREGYCVWLTTIPVLKSHLAEAFKSFAVTLKPFSEEDQKQYLIKYFTAATTDLDVISKITIVEEFVEQLLTAVKEIFNRREGESIEIPLQNKLLAEIFADECRQYLSTNRFEFNDNFDLFYLYRKFIDQQFRKLGDKFKTKKQYINSMFQEHRSLFALKFVFPLDDVETQIFENLNDYYKNAPDSVTIWKKETIIKIDENLNISCIHKTFAEYFTAQWIAENLNNKDEHISEVVNILLKKRFTQNYTFLFYIFDRILSEGIPLHRAIINEQIDKAAEIINSDAQSNAQFDNCGRSAVHLIALYGLQFKLPYQKLNPSEMAEFNTDGMLEIIEQIPNNILLEIKTDNIGYTPLDCALANCSLLIANKIYDKSKNSIINADINLKFKNDYFQYCSDLKFHNLIEILLPYFASRDLLLKNVAKNRRVGDYFQDHISNFKDLDIMQLMQAPEGQLYSAYTSDYYFWSHYNDLRYAIIFGTIRNVNKLLSDGVNINKQDTNNCTPLHYAVLHEKLKCVDILLTSGCKMNHKNNEGNTPLHLAVLNSNEKIIKMLLCKGAKINIVNKNGDTALHLAIQSRNNRINEKISTKNSVYINITKLLISNSANINTENKDGETPLHLAAKKGFDDILTELLLNGAKINTCNCNGCTPLHLALTEVFRLSSKNSVINEALLKCCTNVAELLATYGANVNIKNKDGDTPFHLAAMTSFGLGILASVINRADINSRNKGGNTALHLASMAGITDAVGLLISYGADVNMKNKNDQTPTYLASLRRGTEFDLCQ